MVCVAAFIVLLVLVLFVPVLSLFNKTLAQKIWRLFKAAAHCVGRKTTFRKCDTDYKNQVKNALTKKVVLKHPSWVKPISVAIEIAAVLLVLTTIWSLLVVARSLTSLAAYGTCDIERPESCVVGDAEACYAGEVQKDKNPIEWLTDWFTDWGEAFKVIPSRFINWRAEDFIPENATYFRDFSEDKPVALEIFDPGCQWCRESYVKQEQSGFFDNYNVTFIPYALYDGEKYNFENSDLIVRYIEAVRKLPLKQSDTSADVRIIDRLFAENSPRKVVWQEDFKNYYSDAQAREVLNSWLKDFGYSDAEIEQIKQLVDSVEIRQQIDKNREVVEQKIEIIKIPTMIYDGKRHDGNFES